MFGMDSYDEIFKLKYCTSVGGIMVSIAAFQAVDPGSIPGRRNFNFLFFQKKFRELNLGHVGESHES